MADRNQQSCHIQPIKLIRNFNGRDNSIYNNKREKYTGISLKNVHKLYLESFYRCLKDTKVDINEWKAISWEMMGKKWEI